VPQQWPHHRKLVGLPACRFLAVLSSAGEPAARSTATQPTKHRLARLSTKHANVFRWPQALLRWRVSGRAGHPTGHTGPSAGRGSGVGLRHCAGDASQPGKQPWRWQGRSQPGAAAHHTTLRAGQQPAVLAVASAGGRAGWGRCGGCTARPGHLGRGAREADGPAGQGAGPVPDAARLCALASLVARM